MNVDGVDESKSQSFADRLCGAIEDKQTPLIVGLDPRAAQLPAPWNDINPQDHQAVAVAYGEFCRGIVDVVAPLVPAVKPQAAFFERLGPVGMQTLHAVSTYAQSKGLLVIMDAKRGDIGSTAEAYAEAFLGDASNSAWGCDALTVNPYLGDDSLTPFVDRCAAVSAGIFVLVRTSNPGGRMLQELQTEQGPMYHHVAQHVQKLSADSTSDCGYGPIGAVIGATHPQQLIELRHMMPQTLFLVPGLGAQGATAADIAGAFDDRGLGAVINSSRAIIFAHQRDEFAAAKNDWQRAVELATLQTRQQIGDETSAGQLLSAVK